MKFQMQTVAALAMLSGSGAFCPAPITSTPATQLMANNNNNNDFDLGKAAMSFVAASVVAVSSTNVILPVQPAFAKQAAPEKVDLKKLPSEERNKIVAKRDLDLAQQSLKEYQKIFSEAKSAESKASAAVKSQEKMVDSAKKTVIQDSDKLSKAKSAKMPASAIKELTEKLGKCPIFSSSFLPLPSVDKLLLSYVWSTEIVTFTRSPFRVAFSICSNTVMQSLTQFSLIFSFVASSYTACNRKNS